MEIVKNNIHMNRIIRSEIAPIHINYEGQISPESQDMISIIQHRECVNVDNATIQNEKILISGTISYGILYYANDEGVLDGVEGEIPFEESIKITGIDDSMTSDIKIKIINVTVKSIDDRNYLYKIQMAAYVDVAKMEDLEVMNAENDEKIICKKKYIDCLSVVDSREETLRINEQIGVPLNKSPIGKVLWKDIRIKNINTKMLDGAIYLGGELHVFIFYTPENAADKYQWLETTLNFGKNIDMTDVSEEMTSYIDEKLEMTSLELQLNDDNETRLFDVGAIIKFNIKLYEEKHVEILDDLYGTDVNLVPVVEEKSYDRLLIKNSSHIRNAVKIPIFQNKGGILQICNCGADAKIDNISIVDNGMKITGKINAYIMYISTEDSKPVCCQWKESGFEHVIDADGITLNDNFYINWRVEQVSANMLSAENVEVKSVVALETIIFKKENENFICNINEEPMDYQKMENIPLIRGYVVKSGDTLWKLAKENLTTMECIMKTNHLENEQIKKGDRLILVKSC